MILFSVIEQRTLHIGNNLQWGPLKGLHFVGYTFTMFLMRIVNNL